MEPSSISSDKSMFTNFYLFTSFDLKEISIQMPLRPQASDKNLTIVQIIIHPKPKRSISAITVIPYTLSPYWNP